MADHVEGMRQACRLPLATGQMFEAEYRLQRKDGTWICFQAKAVSSYKKEGKRFTVGTGLDITARRHAEEK
jgi:PAS domain S-box-containing protein